MSVCKRQKAEDLDFYTSWHEKRMFALGFLENLSAMNVVVLIILIYYIFIMTEINSN